MMATTDQLLKAERSAGRPLLNDFSPDGWRKKLKAEFRVELPKSATKATLFQAYCTRRQMEKAMGPDPDKHGIFRDHNCWKCKSGEYPCCNGNPRDCEFPHARND